MFRLNVDDQRFRSYIKAVVAEALHEYGIATIPREVTAREPNNFFASSRQPTDVLRQLQAPDPEAGGRREPHWLEVSKIQIGDRVFFRDAGARHIVGYGYAKNIRRGPHPWDNEIAAIIVEIGQPVRFPNPIEDGAFRELFKAHGGNTMMFFPLFQSNGRYARKTYVYPLKNKKLVQQMLDQGGVPPA